jgi:hypothetical protein
MPTTAVMCKEAILSRKDRAGSSCHAITAYIIAKYTPKALTAALSKDNHLRQKQGLLQASSRGPSSSKTVLVRLFLDCRLHSEYLTTAELPKGSNGR